MATEPEGITGPGGLARDQRVQHCGIALYQYINSPNGKLELKSLNAEDPPKAFIKYMNDPQGIDVARLVEWGQEIGRCRAESARHVLADLAPSQPHVRPRASDPS